IVEYVPVLFIVYFTSYTDIQVLARLSIFAVKLMLGGQVLPCLEHRVTSKVELDVIRTTFGPQFQGLRSRWQGQGLDLQPSLLALSQQDINKGDCLSA